MLLKLDVIEIYEFDISIIHYFLLEDELNSYFSKKRYLNQIGSIRSFIFSFLNFEFCLLQKSKWTNWASIREMKPKRKSHM